MLDRLILFVPSWFAASFEKIGCEFICAHKYFFDRSIVVFSVPIIYLHSSLLWNLIRLLSRITLNHPVITVYTYTHTYRMV